MIENNIDTSKRAVLVFVDEVPAGTPAEPLIKVLFGYWRSIALCVVIAASTAIIYGLLAPKWYRAQTLIASVPMDTSSSALGALGGDIGGLASLVGIDIGGEEDQEKEALARMTSREFIYEFIKSKNLMPILFASKWDGERKAWKNPARAPDLEDGYQFFVSKVFNVSEDRKTELVKVAVDWSDPGLARDWANELVLRLNADRRAIARAESERNLQFLNRELDNTGIVDLRQAINRLVESEIRKRMLVNVREEYVFKVIDPAYLPGIRAVVRPRVAMLTAVAAALGGLFGCGLALFRHFRRQA